MEWENKNGSTIKLALDCTVTENYNVLRKKSKQIVKELDNNTLTKLKYFQSTEFPEKEKGTVAFMPRVVISIEKNKMEELCQSVLNVINKDKNSNKNFSQYYLQFFLLKKIETQLKDQLDYMEGKKVAVRDKKGIEIMVANIENALRKIQDIILEKENSLDDDSIQRANFETERSSSIQIRS